MILDTELIPACLHIPIANNLIVNQQLPDKVQPPGAICQNDLNNVSAGNKFLRQIHVNIECGIMICANRCRSDFLAVYECNNFIIRAVDRDFQTVARKKTAFFEFGIGFWSVVHEIIGFELALNQRLQT